MKKNKILLVSGSFYPEISPRSFRTTELAKELARQGHDVTVYIPTQGKNYSLFEKEHCLKIKNIGELKWKAIELKGGKIELILRRIIRRGLHMLLEWPDIELAFKVAKKLKNEWGYDLLISIAVPHPIHWGVARAIRKERNIAEYWIADCGDPYMGDATDSFSKLFYFKYIEKWFCRRADFITVPFKGAINAYYPEFHEKISVIPQGFKLDDIVIPEFRKQTDYPVFAYAGGFIPGKRDPGPLLDFLIKYDSEFRFIIYTAQDAILADAKRSLKERLEINGILPRDRLLAELSQMDFLINLDNNAPTQLPSKLIDYAITDRPVLNIRHNDDFSTLCEFLKGNYERRMLLDPSDRFDIKLIAKQFVNLHGGH